MKILGLDTSTARLSVAIWENGKTLALEENVPATRHAEAILPHIERVLQSLDLTPKDIDGLAVGLGPGTFTGLRVGISTAQGMAQALQRPVTGVSSFLAAAAGTDAERVLVLEDARQEMLYAAVYMREGAALRAVLPETLISLSDLLPKIPAGEWAVTGPGAEQFFSHLTGGASGVTFRLVEAPQCLPSAVAVAALSASVLAGGGTPPERVTPLYLRRTQAEDMKAKQQAQGR